MDTVWDELGIKFSQILERFTKEMEKEPEDKKSPSKAPNKTNDIFTGGSSDDFAPDSSPFVAEGQSEERVIYVDVVLPNDMLAESTKKKDSGCGKMEEHITIESNTFNTSNESISNDKNPLNNLVVHTALTPESIQNNPVLDNTVLGPSCGMINDTLALSYDSEMMLRDATKIYVKLNPNYNVSKPRFEAKEITLLHEVLKVNFERDRKEIGEFFDSLLDTTKISTSLAETNTRGWGAALVYAKKNGDANIMSDRKFLNQERFLQNKAMKFRNCMQNEAQKEYTAFLIVTIGRGAGKSNVLSDKVKALAKRYKHSAYTFSQHKTKANITNSVPATKRMPKKMKKVEDDLKTLVDKIIPKKKQKYEELINKATELLAEIKKDEITAEKLSDELKTYMPSLIDNNEKRNNDASEEIVEEIPEKSKP